MKMWLVLVFALVLGAALGLGRTWSEFHLREDQFSVTRESPGEQNVMFSATGTDSGLAARAVVVGGAKHDFGVMERFGTLKHTFIIQNEGDVDLDLEKGASTCKCTVLNFGETETGGSSKIVVPPGEKAEIALEWNARDESEVFHQAAEIITNDPLHPSLRLEIHGRVEQVVSIDPDELRFTALSSNSKHRFHFSLWSTRNEAVEIKDVRFSDESHVDFFEVQIEPATPEQLAELSEYATSGFRGTLVIKPGLPTGTVNQALIVETNLPNAPELLLPIKGSVVSDVSVVGDRRFLGGAGQLVIGAVKQSEGAEAQLFVLVKGDQQDEVEIELKSLFPSDVLKVEFGEPTQGKAVRRQPIKVVVPPGARPVTLLGTEPGDSGEIILKTTHPQQKEVKIQVRFAVNPE